MIKSSVTITEVIDLLNEMVKLDPTATCNLVKQRIPCSEALAGHETIQVREEVGMPHVGLLGVLNGIFGIDDGGWGPIVAVFEDGSLVRFQSSPAKV